MPAQPPTIDLWCADVRVCVDRSICEGATERVHWRAFTAPPGPIAFELKRVESLPEGALIDAPLGQCRYTLESSVLTVAYEDGAFRGELALRLAWYLAVTRLGGALLHASAVEHGGRALVAAGVSGAGKSTLARLCRGGGLRVLTDEVVAVFPDGRVSGTPFRSDADNVGHPGIFPAARFVALKKAALERFEPLTPREAVLLAQSQAFEVRELGLDNSTLQRRLLGFLAQVPLATLAFRNDPAVGPFVAQALEGR